MLGQAVNGGGGEGAGGGGFDCFIANGGKNCTCRHITLLELENFILYGVISCEVRLL